LQGGKDHAASRYIYTRLANVTRLIFHADDDKVLQYLDDEGQSIEPKWYCPILPTVLVNGADGIGTGWSTSVPNYNPRDIIRNLRKMLRGEAMENMVPWYRGFRGSILVNEKEPGRYDVVGCIEKKNETTLVISELPVKTWTQSYKEWLEEQMPQEGKKSEEGGATSLIQDFREFHTENTVHFEVTLTPEKMKECEAAGFEKSFKMKSSVCTTNMVLFDAEGKIAKYNSALDILQEFCKLRRSVYVTRKAYLVSKLTREKEILSNKARFILMVVKGELELRKRKKADLLKDLQKHGFKMMSELDAILEDSGKTANSAEAASAAKAKEDSGEPEAEAEKTDYDYLLGMNLWSLTFEKVEELKQQFEVKKQELEVLQKTTIEMMWDRDLEALLKGLDEIDALEEEEAEQTASFIDGRRKKDASRAASKPVAKKAAPKAATDESGKADKALLKRPLQEGGSVDLVDVAKTTWGAGAPPARKNPEAPAPPRGSEPVDLTAPAPKARRTAAARGALQELPQTPAPAPAPPEDAAGLLSRLLNRTATSIDTPKPAVPALDLTRSSLSSNFSTLGGSEDLFSYLGSSSSSSNKPFNALDFGAPPGIAATDSVVIEDDAAESKPKAKAKGRAKAAVVDDDDDGEGRASKRRKA